VGSELDEAELLVGAEQGVVPVHHPVAPGDLPDPGVDQLRHVEEGPRESESGDDPSWRPEETYPLPVATCLGLTSARLNSPKNFSQGATS